MIRAFVFVLPFSLVLAGIAHDVDAAPKKKAGAPAAANKKKPNKAAPRKSGSDFKAVLARLDKDGNLELTFAEFSAGLTGDARKKARTVFDSMQDELDPQSVGRKTVSRDELRSHFKKYQQLRQSKAGKGKPAGTKPGAGKGAPKNGKGAPKKGKAAPKKGKPAQNKKKKAA